MLKIYEAELTPDAIRAVTATDDVLRYQSTQLKEIGIEDTDVAEATTRLQTQLESERPWRDVGAIDTDLDAIRSRYMAERQSLLQWQEQQAESTRARIKARDGFSTLTGEQSHRVLRPLALAVTDTTAEAIAPPLVSLKEPFALALRSAEDQANELLDEILSEGERPIIARVDLQLRNREVVSEADVEALVDEIRRRLLEQVHAGARVRLL